MKPSSEMSADRHLPCEEGEFCEMVLIENQKGLHARAAAKFVRVVDRYKAEVTVMHQGLTVSGHSIMGLMMLAATKGTQLKLCVKGEQAMEVLADLRDLAKRKFDES